MELLVRKSDISKVRVIRKEENPNYKWIPYCKGEKIFFGLITLSKPKNGYWEDFMYCGDPTNEKNLYVEENIVYYNPHIELLSNNGHLLVRKFFEDEVSLNKYLKDNFGSIAIKEKFLIFK